MGNAYYLVKSTVGLFVTEILTNGKTETRLYSYDGKDELIGTYETPNLEALSLQHRKLYFEKKRKGWDKT